jgi:hypothetical protein
MTLSRNATNRILQEQQTSVGDVPARWRVTAIEPKAVPRSAVNAPLITEQVNEVSVRIEHADGDHTVILGSIIPGPRHDPVERDYSFLED